MRFMVLSVFCLFLLGCANGMSMRFEVGPNMEDDDFAQSLTKLNEFTSRMSYSYGAIKFAPVAQFSVEGGEPLDVQRLFVMDGGLFLVSHNMVDDQFYPVGYFAYSQIKQFSVDEKSYPKASHTTEIITVHPDTGESRTFKGVFWGRGEAEQLSAFVQSKLNQ